MNEAQEMFLVLFSIMYGVMLQSLSGLKPFPLGRTFRGYVNKWGYVKENCKLRVALSFCLLNACPFVYLFIIMFILKEKEIYWNFSGSDFMLMLLIFWSSLGVFGFYRIYHAVAVSKKFRSHFSDIMEELERRSTSFDASAHLFWGLIYIFTGPLCLLLFPRIEMIFLLMVGIISLLAILHLYYRMDPNSKSCQICQSPDGQKA